jgi:hypothetical protein
MRYGRVGCPLCPGSHGVPTTAGIHDGRRLPPHNGRLLPPQRYRPTRDVKLTRRQQGFSVIHPFGLPLACNTRSERAPLGLPSSFEPGRYRPRTSRWGQVWNTDLKSRLRRHAEPPIDETHSYRATSCRRMRYAACRSLAQSATTNSTSAGTFPSRRQQIVDTGDRAAGTYEVFARWLPRKQATPVTKRRSADEFLPYDCPRTECAADRMRPRPDEATAERAIDRELDEVGRGRTRPDSHQAVPARPHAATDVRRPIARRRYRRRRGERRNRLLRAIVVLGGIVFVIVGALLPIWREEPAETAIRGTVTIERCQNQVKAQGDCYGLFTSDDGTVRIPDVLIRTDVRNTTVPAQVDSATDTVAGPPVEPERTSRLERILKAALILGLAGLLLVLVTFVPHDPPDPASD